jgi:hypothetical protein
MIVTQLKFSTYYQKYVKLMEFLEKFLNVPAKSVYEYLESPLEKHITSLV